MQHVNNERLYVVSYREIAVLFLTFLLVLFFLYPKDLLEQHVLTEESNYDLSILYLQNMLQHDKENEALILSLAKLAIKGAKIDLATQLVELLMQSSDVDTLQEAHRFSYLLHKQRYENTKESVESQANYQKLLSLFDFIMKKELYTKEQIQDWYHEALYLNRYQEAQRLLVHYSLHYGEKVEILEKRYYLAMKMGEDPLALLHKLQQKDKHNAKKWLMAEFYYLQESGHPRQLEKFLIERAFFNSFFQEQLSEFYIREKKYDKAVEIYEKLYQQTHQIDYLKKAIAVYQGNNMVGKAADFANGYENSFLATQEMREYLLRLYLAASQTQRASSFAKKILELK